MNFRSIFFVFTLMIYVTGFVFIVAYIQEGVGPDVLTEINNVVPKIITNSTQQAEISQRITQFNDNKINYDYIFMLGFVFIELLAINLAINSPKLPNLSFTTSLFFLSAALLFIYPLLMQVNSYIYSELIVGLFTDTVFVMPLYNWFMSNQLFVFMVNVVFLFGINKLFGKTEQDIIVGDGGVGE